MKTFSRGEPPEEPPFTLPPPQWVLCPFFWGMTSKLLRGSLKMWDGTGDDHESSPFRQVSGERVCELKSREHHALQECFSQSGQPRGRTSASVLSRVVCKRCPGVSRRRPAPEFVENRVPNRRTCAGRRKHRDTISRSGRWEGPA